MKAIAFLRLMRMHKPVGTILLWLPVAWALWLANHGIPPVHLLVVFFLGTVLMRSAGCVVNDLADRQIDKHVHRTKLRPLVTGEVHFIEAVLLLVVLFFLAFLVVIQLPIACFYYAIIALVLTLLYPFCKRFLDAPQLVLGLAFSMGIPMAYVASNQPLDLSFIVLFTLNFAWIIAYDTMYAMVDREDDLRIGVKSTAILFVTYDRNIIAVLQVLFHGLWIVLAQILHVSMLFYVIWFLAGGVLVYQQYLMRRSPEACFTAFLTNSWYGAWMWLALILGKLAY